MNIDFSVYFAYIALFSYLYFVMEILGSRRVAHPTQLCKLLRKPKLNLFFKIVQSGMWLNIYLIIGFSYDD
jgi:hypothetical protein